ncbi:olfactory receptor 1019-like [Spea bombifrons]|uniref:olfactory receptor 1019-like n=1 Tax=Spea bombifrons TaxID=233779 RepID=UPI0023496268|nr:olfactory receptor 1019-like [Spea bombifrons]
MMQLNQTMLAFFIIQGISDVPGLQVPIFLMVLVIYLLTLVGNMTILLLVCSDPQLHKPMYFFLCNLSILDLSSINVTLHNTLAIFISGDRKVSFLGCMAQVCMFSWLSGNELILLTAMSYDRYVAICKPLRYPTLMNQRVCVLLAVTCWVFSLIQVLPPVFILAKFSCYTSNKINHFFCDIVILMRLSCSDTSVLELLIFTEGVLLSTFTPFVLTFTSYVFIINAIMRIKTNNGRRKAFHTCSSHLTVVTLLYVILVCQYLTPTSTTTLDFNKFFSLFNTAAVPMLNPLIYSLKNKDVKLAARRRLKCFKIINHPKKNIFIKR